jgi:hypothetical protein
MSDEQLSVAGGADGIVARTDDLYALADVVQKVRLTIADVSATLSSPWLRLRLAEASRVDPFAAVDVEQRLDELIVWPSPLCFATDGATRLWLTLLAAAAGYEHTEDGIFGAFLAAVGDLFVGACEFALGQTDSAEDRVFEALPGLTPLAMRELEQWGVIPDPATIADGHPVLHDLGPDRRVLVRTPPTDLGDLVRQLALRNEGRHGEISVSVVTDADGTEHAIVDIPGTKSWNLSPNPDATSVGTDLRAMAGLDTSYEEGVMQALAAAGVGRQTDVMLVGHSEGGIIAINTARDAVRSGRFRITHVVTAGSPIGEVSEQLPRSVQVLALENDDDVVPATDSAGNPEAPNLTTVHVADEHDSIGGNHSLDDTYVPEADAADASGNASIDAFVAGAGRFLTGVATRTHAYQITRGF